MSWGYGNRTSAREGEEKERERERDMLVLTKKLLTNIFFILTYTILIVLTNGKSL